MNFYKKLDLDRKINPIKAREGFFRRKINFKANLRDLEVKLFGDRDYYRPFCSPEVKKTKKIEIRFKSEPLTPGNRRKLKGKIRDVQGIFSSFLCLPAIKSPPKALNHSAIHLKISERLSLFNR